MALRIWVVVFVGCMVFANAFEDGAGATCGSTGGDGEEEVSMLQARRAAPPSFSEASTCSTRSLIVGQQVGDETYLQWDAELRANGASAVEFVNLTLTGNDVLRFETDVKFVTNGKPTYGIVYVRLPGVEPLRSGDAAKLKAHLDRGGMLVVGETDVEQVNALMTDLGSTIFAKERSRGDVDCSTPEDVSYLPSTGAGVCAFVKDVAGLQGSRLDEIRDSSDGSYPLFYLASNPRYIVARVERRRPLVVVGDDEPFDDDCATYDSDNRLAFGVNTNLQFFKNLFLARCRAPRSPRALVGTSAVEVS